ncbi:MAG TPA: GNAT family protein [Candidatus Tectomicrobia bacterium]|nr:GNAT family protein [Candidatus Tectomicrobia bacterium]
MTIDTVRSHDRPLRRRLAAAVSLYRAQGLGAVLRRLVPRLWSREEFVILQCDLRELRPVAAAVAFRLERVDDDLLARFREMPPPFPRHHAYRFRHGQRHCYAAFADDGRIIALMWPSFQADNDRVVSRWRRLWPDEARIGSIWADPAYRGTGVMGACIARLGRVLQERGFRYLYACTWVGNQASLRLHERLGFRRVGRAWRYSFRWQREGAGIYLRTRIDRAPLGTDHPGGDTVLPRQIP